MNRKKVTHDESTETLRGEEDIEGHSARNDRESAFDRIREGLIKAGWLEQECGSVYLNGKYATNLYSADEDEVIHLSHIIFPDAELIETLKGEEEMDREIRVECPKCKRTLFRGTKLEARRLVIYCPDCRWI